MATPSPWTGSPAVRWPEHQDQDEDPEDHRLAPGLAQTVFGPVVETLDDPDEQPADDRADEIPDTAQNRGRERDEAEFEPGVIAGHPLRLDEEHRGGAGHQTTEEEGERDRGVDVDTHEPGAVLILRHRAHRLAPAGPLHDVGEHGQQHRGDDEHDE